MSEDLKKSRAVSFFHETSLSRASLRTAARQRPKNAAQWKAYPQAGKVTLPRTSWNLSESRLLHLLQQRRSLRRFADESMTVNELAFMLWSIQGITAKAGSHLLRTSPSAGALYPIETYLSIHRLEGLNSGLYHFDVRYFQLSLLREGNTSAELAAACLDQGFMADAAFCLVWTAVPRRCLSKYGDRGARYLLLDAAHICQNALLAAEALDCGGCPVAAFFDDEVSSLLDIDGVEEIPLYAAAIGRKR